ncbi:MAG: hypothetical protein K9W44_10810 [Candidatus Lokiarchaeota archaeon]|nr:hypothetical protein [Candidatus Harpocratesius repetitus]
MRTKNHNAIPEFIYSPKDGLAKNKAIFFRSFFSSNRLKVNSEEQKHILNFLEDLLKKGGIDDIEIFYEILTSHESLNIRKIAHDVLINVRKLIDREKLIYIMRLWVNYPMSSISDIIAHIDSILNELDNEEYALHLIYKLLYSNKFLNSNEMNVIEKYISDKPILYLPIQRAIQKKRKKDKSLNFGYLINQNSLKGSNSSIIFDLDTFCFSREMIFNENPEIIWRKMLNSSILTMIYFFNKIHAFQNWAPPQDSAKIFYIIKETFSNLKWEQYSSIMLECLECDSWQWDNFNFHLTVSPYFFMFPGKNLIKPTDIKKIHFKTSYYDDISKKQSVSLELENGDKNFHIGLLEFNTPEELNFYNKTTKIIFGDSLFSFSIFKFLCFISPLCVFSSDMINTLYNFIEDVKNTRYSYDFINSYSLMRKKHNRYRILFQNLAQYIASLRFYFEFFPNNKINQEEWQILNSKINHDAELKVNQINKEKRNVDLLIDFGEYSTKLAYAEISQNTKNVNLIPSLEIAYSNEKDNENYKNWFKNQYLEIPTRLMFHPQHGVSIIDDNKILQLANLSSILLIHDLKSHLYRENWSVKVNIAGQKVNYHDLISKYFFLVKKHLNLSNFQIQKIKIAVPRKASNSFKNFLKETFSNLFGLKENEIVCYDEMLVAAYSHLHNIPFKLEKELIDSRKQKNFIIIDWGASFFKSSHLIVSINKKKEQVILSNYLECENGGDFIEKKLQWNKNLKDLKENQKIRFFLLKDLKHQNFNSIPSYFQKFKPKIEKKSQFNPKKMFKEFCIREGNQIVENIRSQLENYTLQKSENKEFFILLSGQSLRIDYFKDILTDIISNKKNFKILSSQSDSKFLILGLSKIEKNPIIQNNLSEELGLLGMNQGSLKFIPMDLSPIIPSNNLCKICIKPLEGLKFVIKELRLIIFSKHPIFQNISKNLQEDGILDHIVDIDEISSFHELNQKYILEEVNRPPFYIEINSQNGREPIECYIYINSSKQIIIKYKNIKEKTQENGTVFDYEIIGSIY